MVHGTLLNLKLKRAARLLDSIKSLSRLQAKGDTNMSEFITELEQLGVDGINGRKPLITMLRASEIAKGIAQYNNAKCRLVEYGLIAEQREALEEFRKGRQAARGE